MQKRLNRVRCSVCNTIVGHDPVIKLVAKCCSCHSSKKKLKSAKKVSPFAHVKKGKALDLPSPLDQISMRSSWERNFARWLCLKGVVWTFEEFNYPMKINPDTGKWYPRKPWGYLPDFLEVKSGAIWEVKGFFRSKDRSKVRRFRKHYPEDFKKLRVCLSRTNKKALAFYRNMGVPVLFYEEVKEEYKKLTAGKNDRWE